MRALLMLLALFVSAPAEAQTAQSLLEGCRHFLDKAPVGKDLAVVYNGGVCSGIVTAIFHLGPQLQPAVRFCAPPKATMGDALRIVVTYIDAHTAQQDTPFNILALEALRHGWPCR
jgi:hypothetical protein